MLGEHWERAGVQWVCGASSSVHCVCHITVSSLETSPVTILILQSGKLGPSISTSRHDSRNGCFSVSICSRSELRTDGARRDTSGRFGLKADSRCPTSLGHQWSEGGVTLPHFLTCTLHVWPTLANSMPASVYINNHVHILPPCAPRPGEGSCFSSLDEP